MGCALIGRNSSTDTDTDIITLYNGFSMLHKFSLVLQPWMPAYIRITDEVCMYVFSLPNWTLEKKYITTWPTKIELFMLHWINSTIPNNTCILTKLNAVFILKTVVLKKIFEGKNHGNKLWNVWCRQASGNTLPSM